MKWPSEWYDKFDAIVEKLGEEAVITEVKNYFSADEVEKFCDSLINDYDLDYDEDEEEENEEDGR